MQEAVDLLGGGEQVAGLVLENHPVVVLGQFLKEDLRKPVHKRLRERLAPRSTLRALAGILAREDKEVWVAFEFLAEFWDVDGTPVVQNRVQSFQDTLLSKVHLVNQEPVAFFDRLEKDSITPAKLDVVLIFITTRCCGGILRPK